MNKILESAANIKPNSRTKKQSYNLQLSLPNIQQDLPSLQKPAVKRFVQGFMMPDREDIEREVSSVYAKQREKIVE